MGDIYCPKCGEPWDSYHVQHDMKHEDRERFKRGEGCESCEFGTKCTNCSGTGHEPEEHSGCVCRGDHYRVARLVDTNGRPFEFRMFIAIGRQLKLDQPVPTRFAIHDGFEPKVHTFTKDERSRANVLKVFEEVKCLDGWYVSVKLRCPTCMPVEKCHKCGGDGKFKGGDDVKSAGFKLMSEILEGDEDGLMSELEDLK